MGSTTTDVFGQTLNPAIANATYQLSLNSATGTVYIDSVTTGLVKVTLVITWIPGVETQSISLEQVTYIAQNGIDNQ